MSNVHYKKRKNICIFFSESVCEEARLGGPSRLGSRGDWSGAISRGERSGVTSRQKNATPDNPPGLRLHRSTTQREWPSNYL